MKQYISKLVLSLSVVALLFNCETEELSETNNVVETPPKSTIHKITHDKIIKNKTLSKQLSTLTKAIETHNKQHKTVYSSAYNFYINTDYATYIENPDGEGHTYTFNIQRDTETPVLENLVLSSTDNNNYTMHLVTYNITAQEKERLAQGDVIDLNNKVSSVTLDDAGLLSGIFNKETTITCLEIAISYCKYNNGAHSEGYEENGSQCPGYAEQVIATVGDCDNSSNGNSTGNTDTTNDTTDPTNTTNNNTNTSTNTTTSNGGGANTPVTSPTLCTDCPEISEEDCEENLQSLAELESVFGAGNIVSNCQLSASDVPTELHFNTLEELQDFINGYNEIKDNAPVEVSVTENDDVLSPNQVTTKFKFIGWPYVIHSVYVKQQLGEDHQFFTDYSVVEVTSDISGVTFMKDWEQTNWQNSTDSYNSTTIVNGNLNVTLFYQGVGRLWTTPITFTLVTNATDGSSISQSWD
ncbi:hypothetical protein [Pontimicrobium sp. MEBiC06410]